MEKPVGVWLYIECIHKNKRQTQLDYIVASSHFFLKKNIREPLKALHHTEPFF